VRPKSVQPTFLAEPPSVLATLHILTIPPNDPGHLQVDMGLFRDVLKADPASENLEFEFEIKARLCG
jgi:hypothetical protein